MTAPDRERLRRARRWVVKVGSALLTDNGRGLDTRMVARLAGQIVDLRAGGCEVVLVSSGAVAAGLVRLGLAERPSVLHDLQAAAAVGQSSLVRAYEDAFAIHGVVTAQILLSHADVRARDRYLNARATLNALLAMAVVPVVNENDTVVTDEIRLGDNDTLAALVANLIDADALVILTDQAGLYTANPRDNPDAELVPVADVDDPALDAMVGGSGRLGRGGMVTKLQAARLAARSGTLTLITHGRDGAGLAALAAGAPGGTLLRTERRPLSARKQWLASLMHPRGTLTLDGGAVAGVCGGGRSLLPVGVVAVQGEFSRGDLVRCVDAAGREVARGLINYSADETTRLLGVSTDRIEAVLGYGGDAAMIHRDNLVQVG